MAEDDPFADVLAANKKYAETFSLAGLPGRAARGLAVLTCMDTRIDPLAILGLAPGDAKILRNAGARVTADAITALALARYLLGVDRIMVMVHTRCAMASGTESDLRAAVAAAGGPQAHSLPLLTAPDQEAALAEDIQRLRSSPFIDSVTVGGFRYDVDTGRLHRLS